MTRCSMSSVKWTCCGDWNTPSSSTCGSPSRFIHVKGEWISTIEIIWIVVGRRRHVHGGGSSAGRRFAVSHSEWRELKHTALHATVYLGTRPGSRLPRWKTHNSQVRLYKLINCQYRNFPYGYDVNSYVFYSRDIKPDNILLDEHGILSQLWIIILLLFSLMFQGTSTWPTLTWRR